MIIYIYIYIHTTIFAYCWTTGIPKQSSAPREDWQRISAWRLAEVMGLYAVMVSHSSNREF